MREQRAVTPEPTPGRTPESWRRLRAGIAAQLGAAGVPSPEAEARWLTESVSGFEGAAWVEVERSAPTARQADRLAALVARRLAGEPLQYVLGSWPFRTLDLMVDRRVLIPRPETEWLVEIALRVLRAPDLEVTRSRAERWVVDLGAGSGAIGLAIASETRGARVYLTDVSHDALEVARLNGLGNGVTGAEFHQGDWYDALPPGLAGEVDLIASNPPYVAEGERVLLPREVLDHEPAGALFAGPEGLDAITTVVRGAAHWLRPGGALVVEHAPAQSARVQSLATSAGLIDARIESDLSARPRVLVAHRPQRDVG